MKKVNLNIEDIFNLPSAVIYNPDALKSITDVVIDSRKVKKGSLFIAIKGKNLDGHNFVTTAVNNGAGAIMINRKRYDEFDAVNVPLITVDDSVKTLGHIANVWRKKLRAKVVGITGSSGKTTTKEILSVLLSEKYKVTKTELNNNNHIGVPLTILAANGRHDVLVAEVGTNHFGEIEYSSKILEPDYAMITNIGHSHTEFLKNKKGVLKEKSALLNVTMNNEGKIFLNYDDPLLKEYCKDYRNRITFGYHPRADISGKISGFTDDGKPFINIKYKAERFANILPFHGAANAQNYIASAAVALNLGLSFSQIKKGTEKLKSVAGRLDVQEFKNYTLIDDTYNANPESTKAAIELTGRIKTHKRKIIILGDMFELGKSALKNHLSLKNFIINNDIDEVYTIGSLMKHLSKSLKNKRIVSKHFDVRDELKEFIKRYDFQDSVILVKGSRGMHMEEFSEIIKPGSYR